MEVRSNIRYLNENIVSAHIVMKRIQMVVGGLLSLFFLFGIVEVFIGEIEKRHLPVYLIFFIPSLLLFWRAVRTGMLIESARRYEMIIYGARNGIVTADELELKMGKPGHKIFRELEKIFRKGYLQNCALQRGGQPCIIIYDMVYEGNSGIRFYDVTCRNCGSITRIRSDEEGKCSYCGYPINAEIMPQQKYYG